MKVGLQINRFDFNGGPEKIRETLMGIAQAAESAGFYSEWVMDHFFELPALGPHTDPMLESYTTLGFLAGVTQKVKLGTMVTGVIYREPAILIKEVTTLDVLSGGRAYFGIGAGWFEQEAIALNLPNPLTSQRFDKLEDILKLGLQMWQDDRGPFKGKSYDVPEPVNQPQAVQKPHPPILIGGGGEQKTLKFVAQYGDACNLFARLGIDGLKHKLDVLRGHCANLGRDYETIEKTALAGMTAEQAAENPGALIKLAKNLGELGISHIMLSNGQATDLKAYEKLAKTVAELEQI